MAGPISVTCPTCGEAFPVPSRVVSVDTNTNQVLVRMDRTELYGHLRACAGEAGEAAGNKLVQRMAAAVPPAVLTGRVHRFLDLRAYVPTAGSRACTMCGMAGETCLAALSSANLPCCTACRDGNTHPAPGEAQGSCAEWSAARGAQD